jgi:OFA family oxalate/formate antiporter-like MFS transporter
MQAHLNVSLTAIQGIFTLFILMETWLVPFEGYMVDRIGPRLMLGVGGVMIGLSWIFASQAESLRSLYFWYCFAGGIGAGIVYGGTIGNALKWFPDHRGLCVGLTAGAYGIGTALTVAPIDKMIKASGYQHTLFVWGIIQGVVVLVAALFLGRPPAGWAPAGWKEKEQKVKTVRHSAVDMTPLRMLRQPSFYLIYLMMTMLSFGGLVVTAQLNPMAVSYHVDKVIVAFGMTALVLAITVDRYLNGLTRPFWGWVSDHIGRENTMFIAFTLEAVAVFALLQLISRPVWFIALSGLCFFAWGEIFSLFPSITGDLFGKTWATTNYGIVYTAKGAGAFFAGIGAAWLFEKTGSWTKVFWAMIACDLIAAFMALLWLKPLAARTIKASEGGA